ncbi:MAG: putative aminoglycoside phosphotransferase [Candidatus Heimdallarchaeota archaeon LC_3]|nr:MAG: putative aminoglycoside phosphotransferase [Candidatus Heimdallarchaeota archaeon LC_3]
MIPNDYSTDDTIPVRKDEEINEKQIAQYISRLKMVEKDLIGTDLPLKVRQFGGGAANLTYLLNFGGKHEYVLRRPPLGPVAKSSHDMGREYKVLSVLYKKFPYAPRAFHFCNNNDVIGSNFFIMERKNGLIIRNKLPDFLKDNYEITRSISESMVDCLVELHNVDYKHLGLENLGKPEGFLTRQVEGWFNRWEKAKTSDLIEMHNIYEWMRNNIPSGGKHSLIHNDYKLDNMMFDSDNPKKMVAIFDWDMCTIGDPLSDLGALLAYWSQEDDPEYLKAISTMPINNPGFLTRELIVKRYEEKSKIKLSNINFYQVLGLFRLAVIVAQIYIRYVRKQTQDQRFAGLEKVIPLLARRALELTQ